jgi:transcriptional regulator with XRE-family HTH domain
MNFGEWTRQTVTKEGKTLAWLAKQIGTNQSLVSRWRTGSIPRTVYFLKTCAVIAKLQRRPILEVIQEAAFCIGVSFDVD